MLEKEHAVPPTLFGLITSFGIGGVLKSLFYTLFGALLFGILGYITFLNGPGSTASSYGTVMRIILAGLIIPGYAILGGGGGLVLAVTGTILAHTETLESLLNRLVNPLMAMLVNRLAPDKGIPVAEYLAQLDDKIAALRSEKISGLSGPSRWLYGVILRVFRRFAARNMLQEITRRGENLVTKVSLERFIREGLVAFLREEFESQLDWIRYGVYLIFALMAAYPMMLWWFG